MSKNTTPIRKQSCSCGRRSEVLITYRDGYQRVFCGPHSVYQMQLPSCIDHEIL